MNLKSFTVLSTILALALTGAACGDDAGTAGAEDTMGASADTTSAPESTSTPEAEETPWGVECSEDTDCAAPTDYCVTQPGAEFGYCTIACLGGGSECTYDDWTCNVIGTCEAPAATWCGPPEEIPNSDGFLVACP